MLNYLAGIRARTGNNPVRIRIGGNRCGLVIGPTDSDQLGHVNSADSSPYIDTASSPMVQLQVGNFNANDQPVTYNPLLWTVMSAVSKSVNGVNYLISAHLLTLPDLFAQFVLQTCLLESPRTPVLPTTSGTS
jgi:hypothetical protein